MAFARSAEHEALFARGYPHLRRLIAAHPHDAAAEAWATKALDLSDPAIYHGDWPAEVAARFVRGLANVGQFGIGFLAARAAGRVAAADAGLATPGPVAEVEGRALLAKLMGGGLSHYAFQVEHGLFLLEAMLGTPVLVDAVLTRFEELADLEGKYDALAEIAYAIGFAIRRLDKRARAAAEARVRALVARSPESFTREFLSFVVGGRAALEASERTLGLYCVHFSDDPQLIRTLAKSSSVRLDAQHVYLAGDAVLDSLAQQLRKIDAWRLPWLIEELTPIASRKVDAILTLLLEKKKVAARAQAALDERRGKASKPGKPAKRVAPPKRMTTGEIEKRFDELSAWLAKALAAVRGKKAQEKKVLAEGAQRYAAIRSDIDLPTDENLVHFFGADGCGWKKHRDPALQRLDPSAAELTRWTDYLGSL